MRLVRRSASSLRRLATKPVMPCYVTSLGKQERREVHQRKYRDAGDPGQPPPPRQRLELQPRYSYPDADQRGKDTSQAKKR